VFDISLTDDLQLLVVHFSLRRRTRRRQVGGDTCTCSASHWLLRAASSCNRSSSFRSTASRVICSIFL
jgi:hypothetical protein